MLQPAASTDNRPSSRFLWTIWLAGPVTWIVYFVIGYGLAEFACKSGFLDFSLLGLNALATIEIILTLIAFGVTLYVGFLSYRLWQQPNGERATEFSEPARSEDAGRFMIFSAMMLNAFFAIIILMTGLPAFFIQPCSNY
jgi:heme/copper-type cytochrome/quinol oxidase subunit 2